MNTSEHAKMAVERFGQDMASVRAEIGKMLVGQDDIVEGVLTCLLAGGHALLEGVPGLGKTMLVRSLAQALKLSFSRIQFTPDLMPADLLGTTVISEDEHGNKSFNFRKGPVFSHVVLADEINRATPKTQSALLEVMQEHTVTIGTKTHALDEPYFVLATQNPLEMEGTYPLPEAQLDRFLFKLQVPFPSRDDLHTILDRTTGSAHPQITPQLSQDRILEMRQLARDVPVTRDVQDYAIRILEATHPTHVSASTEVKRFVRFGASPRGAQATLFAAKIRALLDGRFSASCQDVRDVARNALRHRMILNFEGEAEGVRSDDILDGILKTVPETSA